MTMEKSTFSAYKQYGKQQLFTIDQGFQTCGTHTTSGTRRSSGWYASNFHFFTKTWIHCFL